MKTLNEKWQAELDSSKFAPINEGMRNDMALMLENVKAEEGILNEGTDAADISAFTPILVPMVRRVYPALIANNLLGVQAMKTPTAYLYALTYKYTNSTDNSIDSSGVAQIVSTDSAVAVGDTITGDISGAEAEVVYVENGGKTALVKSTNGGSLTPADAGIAKTWSNEAQFQKVLNDYTGPMATAQAEVLKTDMKEMGFNIDRTMAEAKSRKLKGKYSLEMYQDLKAMHGMDAEKELMNLMSLELSWEIDREAVNFVNDTVNASDDSVISAYDGRWEVEKYRGLGIKISNEARSVGQLIRKASANTMLVSPKAAVAMEALGSFQVSTTDVNINAVNSGPNPAVGTFDKRYKVNVDNFSPVGNDEYANVFYKGDGTNKDALGFLAPYVGASFIKTQDSESGQPSVITSTRYALVKNPLSAENYGSKFNIDFAGTSLEG